MKPWLICVLVTVVCWGAYVPMLHKGQLAFGSKNSALRAFLFVGVAYFITSVVVLLYVYITKAEPMIMTKKGMSLSTLAGILGAIGALGIVFAMKLGGKPIYVAPLVFAGAPIMNTFVSMMWNKPAKPPHLAFYAGILLAAVGAALALKYKPV
ncbi:MAG: hypothetical protein IH897_01865 [Planctomycetes bacterium]|nr:hypothetical protein [Planctomycetota bacterium]MCH9033650.1 hypothetical protein [Planctomycetota bacterium]